jgi:hypothetical protein
MARAVVDVRRFILMRLAFHREILRRCNRDSSPNTCAGGGEETSGYLANSSSFA